MNTERGCLKIHNIQDVPSGTLIKLQGCLGRTCDKCYCSFKDIRLRYDGSEYHDGIVTISCSDTDRVIILGERFNEHKKRLLEYKEC
jgi:hypothetical protein